MEISVIIPTYRRKKQVLEAIKSFSDQTYGQFEMVVIDQGPEYISSEEISNFNLVFPLKYVRLDDPNLSKARNAGIKSASGDIIFFCDDDVIPDKSLIEEHIKGYKDDKIGGVGGRIISCGKRKDRWSFKLLHPWIGHFNPLDASPICNFHLERPCKVKHIKGCNMSFRKGLLIKAGLFDESLGGTANLEDADMSFKVRRLGYSLIFEPKALVRHLELTYGGCQMQDYSDLIYWLYFTDTLFYLRYFQRIFFPFFFSKIFVRMLYYSILNRDIKIITCAKTGFLDAIKRYSQAGAAA